jgi:hypothetical protein
MADDVKVKISVDDTQATQAFKNIAKSSDDFTSSFTRGMSGSLSSYQIFEGAIAANIVIGIFRDIKQVAGELFDVFIIKGVDAALVYEESLQGLNVALRNSGQFTKQLSKDFEGFAQKMQETTKYSDNMVLSAATQLQALARLSGEGLQRATKDSIDLAAALRIDLTSAAELVAKAHEGQTTALRRHGIIISDTIAPTEKYAALLSVIESRFGGSAVAQAQTYSARIEILKNQFEESQKAIGNYIIKNDAVTAVLKVATVSFIELEKTLIKNKESIGKLITEGILFLIDSLGGLLETLDNLKSVASIAFNLLSALFYGFKETVELTLSTVATLLGGLIGKFADVFGKALPDSIRSASDVLLEFGKDAHESSVKSGQGIAKAWDDSLNVFRDTTQGKLSIAADYVKNFSKNVKEEIDKTKSIAPAADQPGAPTGPSELQLTAIREEKIFQAELLKIQLEGLNEKLVSEAQFNIAMGKGRLEDIQAVNDYEQTKIQIAREAALKIADNQDTEIKKNRARQKAEAEFDKATEAQTVKSKQLTQKQLLADQDSFLSTSATLASAKNKELAAIGKSAAMIQATIKGYQAVQNSYEFGTEFGGPILGAVFASIAAVATAAQVAAIAGVQFADGGIVPGLSQYGDQVQARLNPGEVVLNKTQQMELLNIANGRGGNNNTDLIASVVNAVKNINLNISIDGREIARTVRDQRLAGYAV